VVLVSEELDNHKGVAVLWVCGRHCGEVWALMGLYLRILLPIFQRKSYIFSESSFPSLVLYQNIHLFMLYKQMVLLYHKHCINSQSEAGRNFSNFKNHKKYMYYRK